MADYPDKYYSPRPKENWPGVIFDPAKKTIIFKEDFDSLEGEILAIEKELALNPKGPYPNVKARLEAIETAISTHAARTDNPHSVTKEQVGLGNVTNDAQLKRAAGDFPTFPLKNVLSGFELLLLEDPDAGNEKRFTDVRLLPFESKPTFDISSHRRRGPVVPERWYTSPTTGTALTTGAPTANVLRAIPFICAQREKLDRIAINVTTAATGSARLGIYKDNGNCYPYGLVVDAGTVDTGTTGVKSLAIDVTLEKNTLYWLVIVSNAAPIIRAFAVASLIPLLGYAPELPTAPGFGYSVAFTFGPLPATFPTGATIITAVPIPAIFVRLAIA